MRLAATALVLFGCGHTVGPFVRSADLRGPNLVLELCRVRNWNGMLSLADCETQLRPLPVTRPTTTVMLSSLPTAGLATSDAVVEAGITDAVRKEVIGCGVRYRIPGPVIAGLLIGPQGETFSITLEARNGEPFARCVATAFLPVRFPDWLRTSRIDLALETAAN